MRKAEVPEIPEALLSAFEALPESPATSALRFAAWKAFSELGLPHSHAEEYSFTSIREVKSLLSRIPGADSQTGFDVGKIGGVEKVSESAWAKAAAAENDAASALAMALAPQHTALRLKAGVRLEQPFPIACRADGALMDAALFMDLEANSAAKIALRSEAPDESFLNASLIFRLGENVELDLIQEDFSAGPQMLKLHFVLERGAKLRFLSTSTGSRFRRLALQVDLMGSHAGADIRSASVVGGTDRCHLHVRVRHHAPDSVSRQLFKAVVLGSGRSSVDGTVEVDSNASRTDARQLIHHLMLSKDGRADAKPRLLIHTDDVKCSHGAAVGRMNPDQQFYLRSRGLNAEAANRLLTQAFLAEALDASVLSDFREAARARLLTALEKI